MTDRLQKELGITIVSFTIVGTMVGGGAVGVAIEAILIVEEKTTFMLLLVMVVVIPIIAKVQE